MAYHGPEIKLYTSKKEQETYENLAGEPFSHSQYCCLNYFVDLLDDFLLDRSNTIAPVSIDYPY